MERYFCGKCHQDALDCKDNNCVVGLVKKIKSQEEACGSTELTLKEIQEYLKGLKFNLKRLVDDPDRDFPKAINIGWPNYCDVVSTFEYIELLIYRMDQFALGHKIDLEIPDGSL